MNDTPPDPPEPRRPMPEPLSPEQERIIRMHFLGGPVERAGDLASFSLMDDGRKLLAALDAERAKVDGPSGLREQLVAARKGEQIEFRLRQQAERERDAERAKTERLIEDVRGNIYFHSIGELDAVATLHAIGQAVLASGEADTDAS